MKNILAYNCLSDGLNTNDLGVKVFVYFLLFHRRVVTRRSVAGANSLNYEVDPWEM